MAELTVSAKPENLDMVFEFIHQQLRKCQCGMELQCQVDLIVEEIYVNIAHYAYHPSDGDATIRCSVEGEPLQVIIAFLDSGQPYNPLEKQDPDITLDAQRRNIGGLGIYMVKNLVDDIQYEFRDGKNILTIQKRVS